ncbi:hypothetical protein SD15574_5427 [Shigella dysenteriae 155-74]|nr:hypothetical protein Sd1012_1817 [Shigella dysenteriae 1012]EGI88673.1 hypothetical protein SD15574_5427 [Shigella dysenteriae 155-74]
MDAIVARQDNFHKTSLMGRLRPYGGFIFDKSMDFIESQDW